MASITAPGVGSGLDINSLVTQLVAAEGGPASIRLAQREAATQAEISALGSLKSSLAGFQSALQGLDTLSDFRKRAAVSADEERFTASATDAAVPATYSVEVVKLAEAHKLASQGYAGSTTSVGSGTLTIQVGTASFQVAIDATATSLADIRGAINDATTNTGVSATIVTVDDGSGGSESKLLLTADATGTANAITVTVDDDDGSDSDTNGLSALVYDPLPGSGVTNLSELNAATDAEIEIDGQTVTRGSNTIGDAIEGVTIELVEAGAPADLTVSLDTAAVTAAVSDFVSAYNALIQTVGSLSSYDADTGSSGVLLGDATLRATTTLLQRELSAEVASVQGGADTLAAIGISTEADGTLTLDTSALDAAMDANFDDLGNLFAAADGIAVRLDTAIDPFVEVKGTIDSRTETLNDRIDRLGAQREALDRRLVALEERFLGQFIAMDALVAQLQSTGSFLEQQFTLLQTLTRKS